MFSVGEHLESGQCERDRQSNGPTPSAQCSSLDEILGLIEDSMQPALTGFGGINRDSFGDGGPPLSLSSGDTNHPPEPPVISDPDKQALQRLVSRAVPQDELPSVIGSIFSNMKTTDIVGCLQQSDAQCFIDMIDQARYHTVLPLGLTH